MIKIIKSSTTTSSDKKAFSSSHIEQFLDDVRRFDETIGSYEQHLMLHDQFT